VEAEEEEKADNAAPAEEDAEEARGGLDL